MNLQSQQLFDGQGNRSGLTDPNNNQTVFKFDKAGRLAEEYVPSGSIINYNYNAKNLVSQIINGRKQETNYNYYDDGRIESFTDPTGKVSFTYYPNGNIQTVSDESEKIKREYDALNRLTQYTDANNNVIKYEYDDVGNLITLTYPGDKKVQYQNDDDNRLTDVTDWSVRTTHYEYDDNSRLKVTTRPDGSKQTNTYNDAGQLIEQSDVDKNNQIINKYNFAYDEAGNVTKETSAQPEQPYDLNNADMTYTSDNRIDKFNGQTVTYDADGNMTNGPLKGSMQNYTYDSRNRLTSVGDTTYKYNAENNRIAKTENGKQISYVVNPNSSLSQVLIQKNDQNNQTYFVYGLGLIGQEDSDGTYHNYHYDLRGSTVAVSDNNGNITDKVQYSPYGQVVNRSGNTDLPLLYNGRDGVIADDNGLYYMRARYYNSDLRRFVNKDTITGNLEKGQTLNRYLYVKGNPISYVDPLGLWGDDVHYTDTYYFALAAGFSIGEATIIANGDLAVDNDESTEPIFGDQSWHFDRSNVDSDPSKVDTRIVHAQEQMSLARNLMNDPDTRYQGLYELGRGLHALQDINAHMDKGYNTPGRILSPHDEGWINYGNPFALGGHFDDTDFDLINGVWTKTGKYNNGRWIRTATLSMDYLYEALK